ncbi:ABC transporter G family member 7 [Hordeum vulgare subsp. vulgare]|uniref:ABC transporter domain-containing protein n=2 Tax=Hordeum vulgare subsp. vulgare TaxID=112509 RepID=A0A8I6WMZ1_HORVV|nr:ABC transporter G family member 7 [Hordeum vulgare subsp. vulgare]
MEIRGLGQMLAALAAALFLRVAAAGAGPALLPPAEEEEEDAEAGEGGGGVRPVTIRWARVTCALKNKRGDMARFLLSNLSGEAKPGRLLALMGPSGSGKTTLLNVLAGQLTASPSLHLSGFLYVNGQPMSQGGYKIAYVRQEDIFFSQLTVRETLSLAAELQLPDTMSPERKEKYVDDLLFRLGLVNSADSIVGDAKVRGISGGEKKRLSLACELIASPSVIFADEPTTGLDAFQAEKVMETLRQLAEDGHTVICSIHQPRGSVYSKFDDIVLLSEGEVVYMGPAKEEPLKYFASLGYQCPDHENPAEFLADLISTDYSSAESVQSSQKRIENLIDEFANKVLITEFNSPVRQSEGSEFSNKLAQKSTRKQRRGWWRQFRLLFKRAWMQAFRDGPTNKVRARMSVASAIIFGSVFWRMGKTQTSIQDRMGLLQVAAINTAMAALTKTVGVFPKERAIVDRERAKGSYALGPYLSSKLLAEIPIGAAFPLMFGSILYPMAKLHPTISRFAKFCGIVTVESFAASAMGLTVGAIAPTTEAAMALGPSLMTVFIVFGGYYVNPDNTPVIFRWIPKASLIRWAFQGLCVNEFKGLQFEHQHSYDVQTGEQALERFSLGGIRIAGTLAAQGRILMFWYWLTYLLLKKNRPRYQQLVPPSEEDQSKQQAD